MRGKFRCIVGNHMSWLNYKVAANVQPPLKLVLFAIYVSCLSYCLVCSFQLCGHLLGKG